MSVRVEDLKFLWTIDLADRATAPLLKATREQERAIDLQTRALKKLDDTTGKVSAEQKDAARQTAAAAQLRAREAQRAADREIAALKRTGKAYGQEAKQAADATDRQRLSVKGLVGGLGGLGAAYGVYRYAKGALSATEDLTKGTAKLVRLYGLSDKEASAFVATARTRGADAKQVAQSFATLSTKLEALASGGTSAKRVFASIGLDQTDLVGKDFSEQLDVVSNALEKLPPGYEKANAAKALFGRGFQTLLPLLNQGADGLRDMVDTAEKYGVTLDGKSIRSTEDLIRAQREAQLASLGLQITLGQTLVPALAEVTKEGNQFVQDVRRDWPQIKHAIEPIVDPILDVAHGIEEIGKAHPELMTVVGGMAVLGTTVNLIKFGSAISGVTTFLKIAGRAGGLVSTWSGVGNRAGSALATSATDAVTGGIAAETSEKGRFARVGRLAGRAWRGAFIAAATYEIASGLESAVHAYEDIKSGKKKGTPSNLPVVKFFEKLMGYREGGMVPAFVSPGEDIHYGGGVWTVPGAPVAADSVFTMLPHGAAVITGHGQQLMAAGASLGEALAYQAPHFQSGGTVVKGKTSTFGPPGEPAHSTAGGSSSSFPGVAIRPGATWQTGKPFLGGSWEIDLGPSHRGVLKQTDLGPNEWTGRRIDITGAGARQLHLDPKNFPTDSVGTARYLGKSGQGHRVSGRTPTTVDTYASLAKNPLRGGLIPDAFAQGLAAGQAGGKSSGILDSVIQAGKVTAKQLEVKGPAQRTSTDLKLPTLPANGVNLGRHKADLFAAEMLAKQAGLRITSTTSGKHAANSWHYKGHAFDASNGTNTPEEKKYALGIAGLFGRNLYELFYDPLGWYVKNGRAVAGKIGGHRDHVHVAMGGPGYLDFGGQIKKGAGKNAPAKYFRAGGVAQRFAGGGTAGFSWQAAGSALDAVKAEHAAPARAVRTVIASPNQATLTVDLGGFDRTIRDAAETRLLILRTQLLRAVQKGGDERVVRRYQQLLDLVNGELSKRVGNLLDGITRRTARTDFATGLVDRRLRTQGTAPDSSAGLSVQIKSAEQFAIPAAKANLRDAQAAFRKAQRDKADPATLRELQQGVTDAITALDETLTSQVERRRQLIVKQAQDRVDDSQFRVDWNNAGRAFLDASQRVQGTAGTPDALRAKAAATQESLPALAALKASFEEQAQAALQTGDLAGYRQALLSAKGAATDLANAQADAADLIKQAADTQADAVSSSAEFLKSRADTGLETLQLQQQLAGTDKTPAGAIERQTYIRGTIIPALQKEIEAQAARVKERADQYGADSEQARAEQLKLDQERNDLLRAQVDGINAVKENTEPLKELAGSSTFDFKGERFTAGLLNLVA